jgi:two-component system, NarL family, sensor histidine kinase DegS
MTDKTLPPPEGSIEALVAQVTAELEKVRNEAQEIGLLVEQNRGEVEKLRQRQAAVSTRLKQIQPAFDTVPREDIRAAYETALDAQQRLFNTGGELERLQTKQEVLVRYGKTLQEVIDTLQINKPEVAPAAAAPKSLLVRLVEAQEAERLRLSRQMHDGPAQVLANFILQAEIAGRLFEVDPAQAKSELAALKGNAATSFQRIRDFIFDLRPMMLDDLGLAPATRRYMDAMKEKGGQEVSFILTGSEKRLPSHYEVILFRAIQQLVGIARDVCQASKVKTMLDLDANRVRIIIEHDGKVLDGKALGADDPYELHSLKERVEMLGGTFEYEGQEGLGTRAIIETPIIDN